MIADPSPCKLKSAPSGHIAVTFERMTQFPNPPGLRMSEAGEFYDLSCYLLPFGLGGAMNLNDVCRAALTFIGSAKKIVWYLHNYLAKKN